MTTVMIIDDYERLTHLYSKMLEKIGYTPIVTTSGDDALQMLQNERPDLILLDIMMEPMDGWELLQEIREDPKVRDIPVIMITAKALFPEDVLTHADSISGYIMKPITRDRLQKVLAEFWTDEEEINEVLVEMRENGRDESLIDEYAKLRRQIRVTTEMIATIRGQFFPRAMERSGSKGFIGAFDELEVLLAERKSRLREIEALIFPA